MGIISQRYLHTLLSNVVLKFVIGLIIAVVTARALGPEGRGEYNLLVLIITMVTTLLNFGIPASNTYFVAQKRFTREQLLKAAILFSAILTVVSFLVLYALFALGLASFLFPTEKLTPTIVASFAILPVVFFNLFAQGIIVGENKIELNNYIQLISQGALAGVLTWLYFLDLLSVPLAIALYAASYLVALAIILATFWLASNGTASASLTFKDYGSLLGFSLSIHIGNLTQFFNYRLDAFIVNYFLGTTAVGLYVVAANLGETLWLLSNSMAAVLLPTLAARHTRSKEISIKATVATLNVSFIAGIAAFLLGPTLIMILFGNDFAGSILPFLILIPGIVVFSLNNVLATYVTSVGRPGLNAVIAFISFLFTVFFDILLIPRYGISGAAAASVISYTVSSLLTIAAFAKLSRTTAKNTVAIVATMPVDIQSAIRRMKEQIKLR